MENLMERLGCLTGEEWNDLFAHAEREERRSIESRKSDLLYRYLGEVDDPEEMLQDFATMKDIEHCGGKTNWFICSDGTFFTCGDCATDALFESGKVVEYDFSFEVERDEKYDMLSKDERIAFCMDLQGITEAQAKEIVCSEMGIPAYENIYVFSVEEIHFNSFDNSDKVQSFETCIEANNEDEAKEKLVSESRELGSVIMSGTKYAEGDNPSITDIMFGR